VRIAIALPIFFCAALHCGHRLQSKSTWRNRWLTCWKMDASFSPRQFRAVATGISPRRVPLRSWKRNEPIIRVCTARSSILAGRRSLPTPMRTCRSRLGKIYSCANALLHAVRQRRRNACRISTGYPASHGCVRMPEQYAIAFFNSVSVGTPVTVYERKPTGRYLGQSRPTFPSSLYRFGDPRFDPRFALPPPPWWWR
jgi:hypothetical protein